MKENKYDDETFFNNYQQMSRSTQGLEGAGEWHELKKILPDFKDKRVLDLGCGFGWHSRYAVENGAKSVIAIDISEKMLSKAKEMTDSSLIEYQIMPMEEIDFPKDSFDIIISSLALHYIEDFNKICEKANFILRDKGIFVFSIEHPVFTAKGNQDWHYDEASLPLHWPVDRYFDEGLRKAIFLGSEVIKYHKTLTTYIATLIKNNFTIKNVTEPTPDYSLKDDPNMKDEFRRPMMLIISSEKNKS